MKRPVKRISKFERITRALRAADPDIVEIVLFGSSVYAPRLSHDVDIMVTTRAKKSDDVYYAAVASAPKNVDVLVHQQGEPLSPSMALSIAAFSRSLWGDGLTRKEAKQFMPVPTYDEARMLLTRADKLLRFARDEAR